MSKNKQVNNDLYATLAEFYQDVVKPDIDELKEDNKRLKVKVDAGFAQVKVEKLEIAS